VDERGKRPEGSAAPPIGGEAKTAFARLREEPTTKMPRLSASDLGVLGRYLYGPRWQSALARELGVSRQLVVYWAGGKRPVSEERTLRIAAIARRRHDKRVAAELSGYIAMVDGLSSALAKTLMLALIANEVQARIAAIGVLTRQIELGVHQLSKIAREEVLVGDGHALAQARAGRHSGRWAIEAASLPRIAPEEMLSNDRKSVHDT
jgi:transcriptional regulator with XRE-family HTH domain